MPTSKQSNSRSVTVEYLIIDKHYGRLHVKLTQKQ